ncbi:MAG: glycoside hydrolase family 88 protein [Bacteroidales bacterium]|nr:glycoside hydrolase family 88 protein [Bacteroidales bacterium]
MKNTIIAVLIACTLLFGCAREPMSVRMVRSEMQRCPSAADLDGMDGRLKWNYTTGLELLAMLDAAYPNGLSAKSKGQVRVPQGEPGTCIAFPQNADALGYADAWYEAIIREDGSIGANYKRSNYNVDHICPARTLFKLYDLTGKAKYRAAIDSIYMQVCDQPRTETGNFWHKKIYPHQVWLDGLYMAQPFYAMYSARCLNSTHEKYVNFDDIADQFRIAYSKCYDYSTGLLRHAWDESMSMSWSDPYTGQSAHSWGRAMGWYLMALVDVLDYMPEDHPARQDLIGILTTLLNTLPKFADPATGMWYQVLDCPGREGNYIEATCSAMFTYVYLKAVDKGYAPQYAKYSRKLYRKLVKAFVHDNGDGTITLTQCCAVAGLGGKENRSGDYDYYIHERITENDPKGVGPFIWASLIYEK